jgi:hypothetical protein
VVDVSYVYENSRSNMGEVISLTRAEVVVRTARWNRSIDLIVGKRYWTKFGDAIISKVY